MVVDASVWISAFVRQDVNHAASRRWLAQRTTVSEDLIAPSFFSSRSAGASLERREDHHSRIEQCASYSMLESCDSSRWTVDWLSRRHCWPLTSA